MVTRVKDIISAAIGIALLYLLALVGFLIVVFGAFVVLPWDGAKALWRRLH
ncbi:hypothetical protein ES703_31425 [subsurface metagenome]